MRKLSLVIMGLLFLAIVPLNSQAALDTEYYDPLDDVLKLNAVGQYTHASTNDAVDVVRMTSYEESGGLAEDIVFKLRVQGTISDAEGYQYVFFIAAGSSDYIIQYKEGSAQGINAQTTSPLSVSASASGDTLTISVKKVSLGNPSNVKWSAMAIYDKTNNERYLDIAPDKIVRISRPYPGETVFGTVTIQGETKDSILNVQDVEIKIGNGNWQPTSSSDGYRTWSYSWDTTSGSDDDTTISIRFNDGSNWVSNTIASDRIDVIVDQGSETSPETLTQERDQNVGDKYTYESTPGEPSEFIGAYMVQMESAIVEVKAKEDISTNSGTHTAYRISQHEEGEANVGIITATQSVDRNLWWTEGSFETVKENATAVRSGSAISTTTTKAEIDYTNPLEKFKGSGELYVGQEWDVTTTRTTDTTVEEGSSTDDYSETDSVTINYKCLRTETVAGYNCFVFYSEEEDGALYTEEYYSPELNGNAKQVVYQHSRLRLYSLTIDDFVQGQGYAIDFSDSLSNVIQQLPDKVDEGETFTIDVPLENSGDNDADGIMVRLMEGTSTLTSTTVTVPGEGTLDAKLEWKAADPGEHTLRIEVYDNIETKKSSNFKILVEEKEEDGGTTSSMLPIAGGLFLLVVIAVAVYFLKVKKGKGSGNQAQTIQTAQTGTAPAAGVAGSADASPAVQADQEREIHCLKCGNKAYVILSPGETQVECPFCGGKVQV